MEYGQKGKAKHRHLGDIVSFAVGKDFLGALQVKVTFKSGEKASMQAARFEELFEVVK